MPPRSPWPSGSASCCGTGPLPSSAPATELAVEVPAAVAEAEATVAEAAAEAACRGAAAEAADRGRRAAEVTAAEAAAEAPAEQACASRDPACGLSTVPRTVPGRNREHRLRHLRGHEHHGDITAADVKKLRDLTGAGMMDCKKALEEADGDFDKAVEVLRIKGAAKAAKRGAERDGLQRPGRLAEGSALIELNCETDFVAKNDDFQALAASRSPRRRRRPARPTPRRSRRPAARTARPSSEAIDGLAAVIGEKLELGRVAVLDGPGRRLPAQARRGPAPAGRRRSSPTTGDEEAARGAAMQIAAMRPQYLTRDEVPADVVENERRDRRGDGQARRASPRRRMPKIVEGRVNGFFKDIVLLEQPSVTDNKKTVRPC